MTTGTGPLQDHGTTARAKGRPTAGIKACPCRPCRDAENAYDKRRRYLNETGRSVRVDAGPATRHLKALFASGAGWNQLVAATRCSSSTLVAIVRDQRTTIARRVSDQILAVQIHEVLEPRRRISALGSTRRCRALIAAGFRFIDIAAASPLDEATIRNLINGRLDTIHATTADGITAAYTALSGKRGTSQRSLNRAARQQWAGPDYWDDADFDNPDFVPATTAPSQRELAVVRRAEVEHLARFGLSAEEIDTRVDLALSTIRQILLELRTGQRRDRTKAAA
ncbi:hypothetical protein [Streptomyces sp. NPDC002913]